jgi:hypothetical protein
MKVAKGTGKATLPGELQVWRYTDHDLVALASEPSPGGASRGLLAPVWRGERPVRETSAIDDLTDARERTKAEIDTLPDELRRFEGAGARKLVASDALVTAIERLVAEAR